MCCETWGQTCQFFAFPTRVRTNPRTLSASEHRNPESQTVEVVGMYDWLISMISVYSSIPLLSDNKNTDKFVYPISEACKPSSLLSLCGKQKGKRCIKFCVVCKQELSTAPEDLKMSSINLKENRERRTLLRMAPLVIGPSAELVRVTCLRKVRYEVYQANISFMIMQPLFFASSLPWRNQSVFGHIKEDCHRWFNFAGSFCRQVGEIGHGIVTSLNLRETVSSSVDKIVTYQARGQLFFIVCLHISWDNWDKVSEPVTGRMLLLTCS